MKRIIEIMSIVALLGAFFGVYCYIENRYALAEELKKVRERLDYKITDDQLKSVQERIWRIQDRQGNTPIKDPTVKEEMRSLEETKKSLENKLKVMEKK